MGVDLKGVWLWLKECKLDQAEYTDMGPLSWDFEFHILALGGSKGIQQFGWSAEPWTQRFQLH